MVQRRPVGDRVAVGNGDLLQIFQPGQGGQIHISLRLKLQRLQLRHAGEHLQVLTVHGDRQIEFPQLGAVRQTGEIREPVRAEMQRTQIVQPGQEIQIFRVGEIVPRSVQIQSLKIHQAGHRTEVRGGFHALQIQLRESGGSLNALQAVDPAAVVADPDGPQVLHAGEEGKVRSGEIVVAAAAADLQFLESRQACQGAEIREIQVIALQRQGREAGGALNALQALQAGYAETGGFQLRHIPQEEMSVKQPL